MSHMLKFGPVALLLVFSTLRAEEPLWTESAALPRIAIPSLAPLVTGSETAVLSIEVESNVNSAADPRTLRFFGLEAPDLRQRGLGTGFLISPDGYALTNHHVVEGAGKISVRVGARREIVSATVIGDDPRTDVALIKLDGKNPAGGVWPHLRLGNSDALQVGDFVVAVGNPFGLSQSVSLGILSAKSRRDVAPSGRQGLYDFLQTDAAINPGNSGGPLLNLAGDVIGINSAINASGQGIGFAIPVNLVKTLLPDLKDKGRVERSWIGVAIQRVTAEIAAGLGLDRPRGALVSQVVSDGPGFVAGLKPGDVIVKFDGYIIEDSSDLPLLAFSTGVDRTVPLEILREGELRSARVKLSRPPKGSEKTGPERHEEENNPKLESGRLGVRVDTLDDELRARLDLPARQKGAVIVRVQPGSVASDAGLVPGDVVIELNGVAVVNREGFVQGVEGVKTNKLLKLLVLRNGSPTFIALPKP